MPNRRQAITWPSSPTHICGTRGRWFKVLNSAIFTHWRKNTMTSSYGNIFRVTALCAENSTVTGEFPSQRPVTWSFDVFFDPRLNKRLSKQSWCWWFETPARPLWCHCNACGITFAEEPFLFNFDYLFILMFSWYHMTCTYYICIVVLVTIIMLCKDLHLSKLKRHIFSIFMGNIRNVFVLKLYTFCESNIMFWKRSGYS